MSHFEGKAYSLSYSGLRVAVHIAPVYTDTLNRCSAENTSSQTHHSPLLRHLMFLPGSSLSEYVCTEVTKRERSPSANFKIDRITNNCVVSYLGGIQGSKPISSVISLSFVRWSTTVHAVASIWSSWGKPHIHFYRTEPVHTVEYDIHFSKFDALEGNYRELRSQLRRISERDVLLPELGKLHCACGGLFSLVLI